jgi:hypothetical protein
VSLFGIAGVLKKFRKQNTILLLVILPPPPDQLQRAIWLPMVSTRRSPSKRNVLMLDFRAGTSDVSLLTIGNISRSATAHTHLKGEDFNNLFVTHLQTLSWLATKLTRNWEYDPKCIEQMQKCGYESACLTVLSILHTFGTRILPHEHREDPVFLSFLQGQMSLWGVSLQLCSPLCFFFIVIFCTILEILPYSFCFCAFEMWLPHECHSCSFSLSDWSGPEWQITDCPLQHKMVKGRMKY